MLVSLTKPFGALRIKSIVLNVPVRAAPLATKSSKASAESPKKLSRAKSKKAPSASSKEASEELKAKPEKSTVPPPPARRANSYSIFTMETYPKLRKDGMSFSEASKIISQKYKELSTAELGALKSRAAAETEILAKKYTAWMKSLSTAQIAKYNAYLKKKGKKGKVVDPERPKRPISAYIMFSLDNQKLPEYEGLSMLEKSRLLSKKWAELSPALKKKYKDLQVKRFAEYARLSEAFSKKLSV